MTALPKTVGACIDLLYKARTSRLALEKQANEQKEIETALSLHIQANFAEADLQGARGKLAMASTTTSEVPILKDPEKFYAFMARKKAWTLLQQRLGVTAVREFWDAGKEVPGVEKMTVKKLSLTKIRSSTTGPAKKATPTPTKEK